MSENYMETIADAFNARPKLYKKFTGKEWK